jgi:hypothetical protein
MTSQPKFVMDDVKLLLNDLASPESGVKFSPPSRADVATIQSNIFPPAITWRWADEAARKAQSVGQPDLRKYGLQVDVNVLFRLTSAPPDPIVWQPVPTGTTTTWTWVNQAARQAEKVLPEDLGKIGIQTDLNTLFQLINAAPPVWKPVPNPTNTSTPFELSTGASDADSFHDFFRLQIAFQDVWVELLDSRIPNAGEQLYAAWDALMDRSSGFDDTGETDRAKTFSPLLTDPNDPSKELDIAGADQLSAFVESLKAQLGIAAGGSSSTPAELTQLKNALTTTLQGCDMLLHELNRVGSHAYWGGGEQSWDANPWLTNTTDGDMQAFGGTERQKVFANVLTGLGSLSPTSPPDPSFLDLPKLLDALDKMLKEPYRFDVFAPASINYGLLLNYRQHWKPQSYQVGNLVSTIPLAPQETRRFTTKTVIKKTRNVKEIDDSLRTGKSETGDTWRVDSEIVDRAKNQTNFQKNASGAFGNDNLYKVSASMQQGQDQAVESAQTKREFHESVVKSAQEYRNEHRIEITTEESREDEATTYREIRNPNDELTVTYLLYELQRRYVVDEKLFKVTPVVMVANEVPAPHEVDTSWILRHDWIIKRTILDDSFLPALEYLSSSYTGEEVTLTVLGLAVEQQKAVVDRISQQVQLANAQLNAATLGLESTENQEVQDLKDAETISIVKSFFDPLGLTQGGSGGGNADRARVDFAKDALNRAQTKANQLVGDLKAETTALQVAIDKYTRAATRHFSMLADIDRLRVHVKDNIIHYMQAIWTYEPADQRYFRLCNLEVPVFTHNTTVEARKGAFLSELDPSRTSISVTLAPPELAGTKRLHQVADLENLIGFKGNYMIFPMVNLNYLNWFMMQPYLNFDEAGVTAKDPDPKGNLTKERFVEAMGTLIDRDREGFEAKRDVFEEILKQLLSDQSPELVTVPSNSLYIEALPGTHPLLEDFKLIHRAIDIKKVQAEVRHAELENLRLAARLSEGQHGDPDIEKVVVVGTGQNVTVDAGQ